MSGQTENGTTYQGDILQARTYNNTLFNAFNPYYEATLNLQVNQPLLKNLGMNATKRQLKLVVVNADAGVAQTLVDASNTISHVETVYWSLVAAWRDVAIQEEALREAIAQQQSNVRLAARRGGSDRRGRIADASLELQDAVFSGLERVSQLQNELKGLVTADASDPIWNANLVPSTSLQQLPSANDLATIVAAGRENRPEVRQAEDRRLAAEIDRALAANQSLPQADVQAQYQSNGFAGIVAPVPLLFAGVLHGLGRAAAGWAEPARRRRPRRKARWRGPITICGRGTSRRLISPSSSDIRSRSRRASAARTRKRRDDPSAAADAGRLRAHRRRSPQCAANLSVRALEAARGARVARVGRDRVRKRGAQFHNGASTTYLVLQRQVELAQARGRELEAQTQLNVSIVELQRVEGTILTATASTSIPLGSQAVAR